MTLHAAPCPPALHPLYLTRLQRKPVAFLLVLLLLLLLLLLLPATRLRASVYRR